MSIFSRSRSTSNEGSSASSSVVTGIDANDTLNIRQAPGASNALVGRLRNGEGVEVVEARGTWVYIRSSRGEGWVSGAYIKTQQDPGQGKQGGQQQQGAQEQGAQEQGAQEQEKRVGFWGRMFGKGGQDADAKGSADKPASTRGLPKELSQLLNRGDLSAAQVQQARAMIEQLSSEQQPAAWQALQAATPFLSQHDNEIDPLITCNVTSLAMCLQVLGVPNPMPSKSYPMALNALIKQRGLGSRQDWHTWSKLVRTMGAELRHLHDGGNTNSKLFAKAFWMGQPRAALSGGSAVLVSIFGHIVRLQEISAAGIKVDDPYGTSKLFKSTGRREYGFSQTGGKAGNDHLWSWEDVENHGFLYVGILSKR